MRNITPGIWLSCFIIVLLFGTTRVEAQEVNATGQDSTPKGVITVRKKRQVASPRTLDGRPYWNCWMGGGPWWWYSGNRRPWCMPCAGVVNRKDLIFALTAGIQHYDETIVEVGAMNFQPQRKLGMIPLPEQIGLAMEFNPVRNGLGAHIYGMQPVLRARGNGAEIISAGLRINTYFFPDGYNTGLRPFVSLSYPKGILSNFYLYYGYNFPLMEKNPENTPQPFNLEHSMGLVFRTPFAP